MSPFLRLSGTPLVVTVAVRGAAKVLLLAALCEEPLVAVIPTTCGVAATVDAGSNCYCRRNPSASPEVSK